MDSIVLWFKNTDWIANALALATPIIGIAAWFWRQSLAALARPRSFAKFAKAKVPIPFPPSKIKPLAQIAIVDDNLSDFPVQELKRGGYDIKTYRHVTVSDFDEIARFDVVFLDMYDIVRDDPTEGGLKLIKILRQKNPRQKICAVSGNQFNPSATAFFRLADDALNKPMSAQRCVEVLEAFLEEKLDPERLANFLDTTPSLSASTRKELLAKMQGAIRTKLNFGEPEIPIGLPNDVRGALLDLFRIISA